MAARQHCAFSPFRVSFRCVSNNPFQISRSLTRRLAFGFVVLSKSQNGVFLSRRFEFEFDGVFVYVYSIINRFHLSFRRKRGENKIPKIEHHAGSPINVGRSKRKLKENFVSVNRISWSSWPLFFMYLNLFCTSLFFFYSLSLSLSFASARLHFLKRKCCELLRNGKKIP